MMPFTFTKERSQLEIVRTVPFDLSFTLTPPVGQAMEAPIRLLHCRTGEGKPRDTEVFELKVSARGRLVVELSGFGGKHPQFREPLKAELPSDGRYRISYAAGKLWVNGMDGATHLTPADGTKLELLFGFDEPNEGVLEAPIGWVLTGIPEADSTEEQPPVHPPVPEPPQPPAPPVTPPTPPVTPPAPPIPGEDPTKALVRELENLVLRYAALQGVDPKIIAAIQIALLFTR